MTRSTFLAAVLGVLFALGAVARLEGAESDWNFSLQYPNPVVGFASPVVPATIAAFNQIVVESKDSVFIGSLGVILRTTNGGQSWENRFPNVMENFWGGGFFNNRVGWMVGSNGAAVSTTDGGESWKSTPVGFGDLRFVSAVSDSDVWVSGFGAVAHSSNGGESWQPIANDTLPTIGWAVRVFAMQHSVVWLAMTHDVHDGLTQLMKIVRSSDGGKSWDSVLQIAGGSQESGDFQMFTALGEKVARYKNNITTDGGKTWHVDQPLGSWDGFGIVRLFNAESGWLQTTKADAGGSTDFLPVLLNSSASAYSVRTTPAFRQALNYGFADTLRGWCLTASTIFHTTDGCKTWSACTDCIARNDVWSQITFASGTAWAFGTRTTAGTGYGLVEKSTDFGAHWFTIANGESGGRFGSVRSGIFISQSQGWMCGDSVFSSSDGGVNWKSCNVPIDSTAPYIQVLAVDDTVWAIRSDGVVERSTDRGNQWNTVRSANPGESVVTAQLFSGNQLVISSHDNLGSAILVSLNGGIQWKRTEVVLDDGSQVKSASFLTAERGVILDSVNSLFRTTDGGLTWNFLDNSFESEKKVKALLMRSDTEIWIGGQQFLSRSLDGGINWTTCGGSESGVWSDFTFSGDTLGWAIGRNRIAGARIHKDQVGIHGIVSSPISSALRLYPNPVSNEGSITVELTELSDVRNARIRLFNVLGSEIIIPGESAITSSGGRMTLRTIDLAPGVYSCVITTPTRSITQRFVKVN